MKCLLGERNEKKAGLDKGRENVMQANKALANLAPDLPCVGQKWPGLYTSASHSHQIQDACGKSRPHSRWVPEAEPDPYLLTEMHSGDHIAMLVVARQQVLL